ncbi:MAG: hypothetical protein ABF461_08075 [Zymomonas mobilis subsp. pomaceae]
MTEIVTDLTSAFEFYDSAISDNNASENLAQNQMSLIGRIDRLS